MATRPFRTEESFAAEAEARNQVVPFLRNYGFQIDASGDVRTLYGSATSQLIIGIDPLGVNRKMRVRLCWRRDGRNPREQLYSAAQLRARLIDDDWRKTVESVAARGRDDGVTDSLFIQPESGGFSLAAIVPNDSLFEIWEEQRRVSANLIVRGDMGRIRKNHAENGSSPTIWLQDERVPLAHRVPDVLWSWPGVVNVMAFGASDADNMIDDTFDDLLTDPREIGRDYGVSVQHMRSGWRRDPKVRADVIVRANGKCERPDCDEGRSFAGFLDVHHILGAGKSDRIWTCVALCPNCHREAHFSPGKDQINAVLLDYAAQFANSSIPKR